MSTDAHTSGFDAGYESAMDVVWDAYWRTNEPTLLLVALRTIEGKRRAGMPVSVGESKFALAIVRRQFRAAMAATKTP